MILEDQRRLTVCRGCPHFRVYDGHGAVGCRRWMTFLNLEKDSCDVWAGGLPPPRREPVASPSPESQGHWGTILWKQLHEYAAQCEIGRINPGDIPYYIQTFCQRIPCGDCRDYFEKLVMTYPPPISRTEIFRWTVFAHNHVNRKTGHSVVLLEDARRAYRLP